jgi:hypothetical protein
MVQACCVATRFNRQVERSLESGAEKPIGGEGCRARLRHDIDGASALDGVACLWQWLARVALLLHIIAAHRRDSTKQVCDFR